MKKILIFLNLFFFNFVFCQTYSGGSGTLADPFLVSNTADLKYLSENSSEWSYFFLQTADITFSAADFQFGGDFYNGGDGFIPIGISGAGFSGSYNGGQKSIYNLYINRPTEDKVGLFSSITGNGIDNLALINVDVTGAMYTGGLVGEAGWGIFKCAVTGSVTGTTYVGGIAGLTQNDIRLSYSTATVTATVMYAGGLAGENTSIIAKCYSAGLVVGVNSGGVVGENHAAHVNNTIYDSEASGQNDTGKGDPHTTAEMTSEAFFFFDERWDFVGETANGTSDHWKMGECSNDSYPVLAWQTIITRPAIAADPSDASNICNFYNTSFSVTATGATSYQWEVSTNGGGSWSNVSNTGIYSGAMTATLSLTDVTVSDNNNRYRCLVTGGCAPNATSNEAVLTVKPLVNVQATLWTTAIGLTSATLNWATVSGSNMRVALRKVGTTTWHIKDAAYADSYVLTGDFSGDVNYEWKVKVQDGGCWGDWSVIETFYVCKSPNAPTALLSTNVFTNKVTLSWTNPGADEMQLRLRKVGTTVWYTQTVPYADSYVYNGSFSKNSTYEWMVRVKCGTAWGTWSATANFTTGTAAGMAVNDTPGVLAEDMFVEAYPNPNNGEFTIQSSHEGTFKLINELGQVVQKIEFTKENNYQMHVGLSRDSTLLHQGIYFITGTINGEVITKKIMIVK